MLSLLSVRCLPGVESADWVCNLVRALCGPVSASDRPIDFGPAIIGVPKNLEEDFLPADVKTLPASVQILLLIMHVNKDGVPLAWRKQDVPGLAYDDPGHIFCPARALREFIGSQRHKTILVASCALSEKQLKLLERVAQESECVLVLNTQSVVEYQDPKEPLLSDFSRLAWGLHRIAQEFPHDKSFLTVDDVRQTAQLICRATVHRIVILDTAGQRCFLDTDASTKNRVMTMPGRHTKLLVDADTTMEDVAIPAQAISTEQLGTPCVNTMEGGQSSHSSSPLSSNGSTGLALTFSASSIVHDEAGFLPSPKKVLRASRSTSSSLLHHASRPMQGHHRSSSHRCLAFLLALSILSAVVMNSVEFPSSTLASPVCRKVSLTYTLNELSYFSDMNRAVSESLFTILCLALFR